LAAAAFERIYDACQHRLVKNGADIVNRHLVQTYCTASNRSPYPKPERFFELLPIGSLKAAVSRLKFALVKFLLVAADSEHLLC